MTLSRLATDTPPEVALEREVEGDLFLQDIGQGFGFRPGTFDGAISISVIQWLLNADASSHSPPQRLTRFFTTLHSALKNPSRAVFQFYPNSDDQVQLITSCAQKAGFGGGLVVDYPNSRKARKMYLCLMVGQQEIPKGLDGEEISDTTANAKKREEIKNERRRRRDRGIKGKKGKKDLTAKEWILKKKDLYRTRGKEGWVVCRAAVLTPQCSPRLQVHGQEASCAVLNVAKGQHWRVWGQRGLRPRSPATTDHCTTTQAATWGETGPFRLGRPCNALDNDKRV